MNKRTCATCLNTTTIYLEYVAIICIVTFVGLCIYLFAYYLPVKLHTTTITKTSENSTYFPNIASNLPPIKQSIKQTTNNAPIDLVKADVPVFKKAVLPSSFTSIDIQPDLTRVALPTTKSFPTTVTLQNVNQIPEISALEFRETMKRRPPNHVKTVQSRTIHVDPYIKPSSKFDNEKSRSYKSKNAKRSPRDVTNDRYMDYANVWNNLI